MLTRVNAATGVAYRDDPTIFAWELINEPRVQGDASGDVLQAWIEDVAAHAKSLDRKHLLTVGSEGFYNGITDPTRAALHNPTAGAEQLGGDYTRNFFAPALDFACVHMWVDLWLSCDEACKLAFADTWIVGHLNASRAAFDKPVLLEEFGKWKPLHVRDDFFRRALEASMPPTSPVASHAAGSMFWHIDPTDYPYNEDGFSVQARGEAATADIVRGAAERAAAASASQGGSSRRPPPGPSEPPPTTPTTPTGDGASSEPPFRDASESPVYRSPSSHGSGSSAPGGFRIISTVSTKPSPTSRKRRRGAARAKEGNEEGEPFPFG